MDSSLTGSSENLQRILERTTTAPNDLNARGGGPRRGPPARKHSLTLNSVTDTLADEWLTSLFQSGVMHGQVRLEGA